MYALRSRLMIASIGVDTCQDRFRTSYFKVPDTSMLCVYIYIPHKDIMHHG